MLFVAMAGVSVLLLPAQALAAFCFNLTDSDTSSLVGQLRVAPSASGEEFTLLMGQFTNDESFCPGGGGEAAPGVGQFSVVGANANVSFTTSGTANCFPVNINMQVNVAAFPNLTGSFVMDIEALAALVQGTFTNVGVACPAVQ
jgi:hypothetical protein